MKKKVFTSLGLMTGTSMDGVDLSIVKSDGNSEFTSILNNFYEFDNGLQDRLMNIRDKIFTKTDLERYSSEVDDLEREFTLFHGKIIDHYINSNYKIDLIGFHGQTIFHDSKEKISKQIGDGKLLSQICKKIVVNNFREQDLLNGGQGAPLTPIFHKLISKHITEKYRFAFPINIINIGGITNITQVGGIKSNEKDLFAYDIGPGNTLIDKWVRKNSDKKFDENGEIAKSGKTDELILNQAIDNFYFTSYDKSLDIKDFDLSFVKGLTFEDGCETITRFTANLISKGIDHLNKKNNLESQINLVCGGGRKNNYLIKCINDCLMNNKIKVENIDNYDFDGDFIESQAFAYLSIRALLNLPSSFPNTTRCNFATVCGIINKNF